MLLKAMWLRSLFFPFFSYKTLRYVALKGGGHTSLHSFSLRVTIGDLTNGEVARTLMLNKHQEEKTSRN